MNEKKRRIKMCFVYALVLISPFHDTDIQDINLLKKKLSGSNSHISIVCHGLFFVIEY